VSEHLECGRCSGTRISNWGNANCRHHWRCRDCGRVWADTFGTPLHYTQTFLAEMVRAVLVVLRDWSLGAAVEQTGHSDDTIRQWMWRLNARSEAITEILERDECLSAHEIAAFWSLIGRKTGRSLRRHSPEFLRPTPQAIGEIE
jgi:transposase-like protein